MPSTPRRYTLQRADIPRKGRVSYEKELNAEQLGVVTAGPGPMLVLAGPGSGKTRTLTYRVAHLLEQGVDPRRILLVTFTIKAAREMLERLERILGYRPEGLWGGTFHHIGNLFLRRHAEKIARTPAFGILDEEDAKDLITSVIAEVKPPALTVRLPQAGVLETLFSLAANTRRPLEEVVAEQAPQFQEQLSFIRQVETLYRERKEQANLLDYDDLLTQWLELLLRDAALRRQYQERFRHVLVDEYQDTNRLQFELVRALTGPGGNVLAVGDDAQSIYAFRGAEVRNLLEFPDAFPKTAIHRLETNYRSTPEILDLANLSIGHNRNQFPKTLRAVQPSGPKPAVVPLEDVRQQAAFIAQRTLELREEGVPLEQIAVLFRARYQAAELELELAKRKIPYVVRGGVRFFEQTHIKDLLAFLRILTNPRDEAAWARILRLQEGIGPAYARRILRNLTSEPDPLHALREGRGQRGLPPRTAPAVRRLSRTFQAMTHPALRGRPAETLSEALNSGYGQLLEERFENARDRKEDLDQLINLASQYTSVERFLEDLSLREPFRGESLQGWEGPDEHLVLSTIHQAKGLEWQALFLIALTEGQFPHPKSLEDPDALEEERRLFYVAVTRAKRELYLTYPLTRATYQRGEILMRPSLFIQELPEDLFELWRVGEEGWDSAQEQARLRESSPWPDDAEPPLPAWPESDLP